MAAGAIAEGIGCRLVGPRHGRRRHRVLAVLDRIAVYRRFPGKLLPDLRVGIFRRARGLALALRAKACHRDLDACSLRPYRAIAAGRPTGKRSVAGDRCRHHDHVLSPGVSGSEGRVPRHAECWPTIRDTIPAAVGGRSRRILSRLGGPTLLAAANGLPANCGPAGSDAGRCARDRLEIRRVSVRRQKVSDALGPEGRSICAGPDCPPADRPRGLPRSMKSVLLRPLFRAPASRPGPSPRQAAGPWGGHFAATSCPLLFRRGWSEDEFERLLLESQWSGRARRVGGERPAIAGFPSSLAPRRPARGGNTFGRSSRTLPSRAAGLGRGPPALELHPASFLPASGTKRCVSSRSRKTMCRRCRLYGARPAFARGRAARGAIYPPWQRAGGRRPP